MFKIWAYNKTGWRVISHSDNGAREYEIFYKLKYKHRLTPFAFEHPRRTTPYPVCRYCKYPIRDAWERRKAGGCSCKLETPQPALFTSQPTAIDLQWYDKFGR